MSTSGLVVLLGYVAVGGAVAVGLRRQGAGLDTCGAAVVAWPFLVHLLGGETAVPDDPSGPLGGAIARAFAKVEEVLDRSDADGLHWTGELGALRRSLEEADRRLTVVDRILADAAEEPSAGGALAESLGALRATRGRAAAEIEAVLDELARLRVQIGIVALSGDSMPVREGLRGLTARVRALDELAAIGPGR